MKRFIASLSVIFGMTSAASACDVVIPGAVVTHSAVVTPQVYVPSVAVPSVAVLQTPVVVQTPIIIKQKVVRQRVRVYGQPVRNVLRSLAR